MTRDYLLCLSAGGSPPHLDPPLEHALASCGCVRRFAAGNMLLSVGEVVPVRSLKGGVGWIVGDLFDRAGDPAPEEIAIAAAASGAKRLIDSMWGSYLLFAAGDAGFEALRDPSGGLACYHAEAGGKHYFTSLPHLLVDCGLAAADLDWAMILHSLTQRPERLSRTQVRGVDEPIAGTRFTVTGRNIASEQLWDPWAFASRPFDGAPAEGLRDALGSTLEAWGRTFRRPLIEISGGLDSAIVAAGLGASAPGASLITFAPAPGDPDETLYARAIADRLGLPLTIAKPRLEDVDLERSLSANLPRPNARAFTQAADLKSLERGRAIGADAFFSGGGGDDMFCYLRTILPAIDRLHVEGVRGMASTALDIARMTHATLWDAFSRVARRLIRRGPSASRADLRFIAAEAASSCVAMQPDPPRDPRLPGKADHVRAVMTIHNYLEGHLRTQQAPIVSPLLSQPIVECSLAIPTWAWCEGGRNRAVARAAFRDRLPQMVLDRRSKGRFDGFCAALLDANRGLLRSMLLDGHLARQGLLDRPAIDAALANPFPPADVVSRLLILADVESWAASWLARPAQRF